MGTGRSGRLRWRPLWLALGWGLAAAIVWLSLTPSPPRLDFESGDKLGHFAAYAALMFWFCQIHPGGRARLAHALGFVAMGVAIEFAQRATGYRDYEALDMLADAAGVAVGWTLARLAGARLIERIEALLAAGRGT
jgi:VanZ family protein